MSFNLPKSLPFNGRQINFAGKGHAPGSGLYLDNISGMTYEIFVAVVERTGPAYSLARVADNQAIGLVRVDHAALNGSGLNQVGDTLLVGPLQYATAGPRTHTAWRVQATRPQRPKANGRPVGMITDVADTGAFGWIIAETSGRKLFVHRSQLRRGAVLSRGQRVTYVEADNGRGPTAFDVQPAG